MTPDVADLAARYWKPALEVLIFWAGYYALLKFLKNTGGLQILRGLVLLFLFFVLTRYLKLETITALMAAILPISVIAFLILFQNELRRGLTRIGQNPIFKLFLKEEKLIDEIVKSVSALAKKKIGALIAIEREISLKQYTESGIFVDGVVSFELISTVFMPNTPLHDGGVIVQGSRVHSAGCLFPLSQSTRISKTLGTRHRAALGLSEETDAVVIVVSEETGTVSWSERGELVRGLEPDDLRQRLTALYFPQKETQRHWFSFIRGDRKNAAAS